MPRSKKTAEPVAEPASTRYQRITPKERKALIIQMKKLYRSGLSIAAVAAEVGKSYGFVQRELSEANVATRTRGGSVKKSK